MSWKDIREAVFAFCFLFGMFAVALLILPRPSAATVAVIPSFRLPLLFDR